MCNVTHKLSLDFKCPAKDPVQYLGTRRKKEHITDRKTHDQVPLGSYLFALV